MKAKRKFSAVKRLQKMRGQHHVKVGLPKGSNPYPDGTDVIAVGVYNEFGTERIPERSFLRSGIANNRATYRKLNRGSLQKIRAEKLTIAQGLGRLGIQAQNDVQDQIVEASAPPNHPATIAAKGSSNPLIDTGHLRQSITYEVVDRG